MQKTNEKFPNFGLDLGKLTALQQRPEPFSPGEPLFWDDPHISSYLLKVHLDPEVDQASRRPAIIDATIEWIVNEVGLTPGDAVLDMGCGPGLYTSRLAKRGMQVTGVDYSRRSIAYAREWAEGHELDIIYRYENYLDLTDANQYDLVMLIYGDYCPLNPEQRQTLLANVRRALRPGGRFVFDVSTREHRAKYGAKNGWHAAESGFWRPGPHLALEMGFDYPEEEIYLDQYIVIEPEGKIAVYRNWFQDFDPDSIRAELVENGFEVIGLWGDLMGTPWASDSEWIGIVSEVGEG
ncbi:class I SAM-dependent methyltransferase [bacterium]|nr:class I SAM-dependent methyltransferase [bacterium]